MRVSPLRISVGLVLGAAAILPWGRGRREERLAFARPAA